MALAYINIIQANIYVYFPINPIFIEENFDFNKRNKIKNVYIEIVEFLNDFVDPENVYILECKPL